MREYCYLQNHSTYFIRQQQISADIYNYFVISLSDEHCKEEGEHFIYVSKKIPAEVLERNSKIMLSYFERNHHMFSDTQKLEFYIPSKSDKSKLGLYTQNDIFGFKLLRSNMSNFLETYLINDQIFIACDEAGYSAISSFLQKFHTLFSKAKMSKYLKENAEIPDKKLVFVPRSFLKNDLKGKSILVIGESNISQLNKSKYFTNEIRNSEVLNSFDLITTYKALLDELIRYVDEVFFVISGIFTEDKIKQDLKKILKKVIDSHTLPLVEDIFFENYPTLFPRYTSYKKVMLKEEGLNTLLHNIPNHLVKRFKDILITHRNKSNKITHYGYISRIIGGIFIVIFALVVSLKYVN